MSKYSTYISQTDTGNLVKLCGLTLREFLGFLNDASKPSCFTAKNQIHLSTIEPAIIIQARKFKSNPKAFVDRHLVGYGQSFKEAIKHPVRIEVRQIKGINGTAQIAVRGIFGVFREEALKQIRKNKVFDSKKFFIRLSGNASFEINRKGVDKGLPIRYFFHHWPLILKTIRYTPGNFIDSFKTNTFIAADGDGTTFDSPRLKQTPTLGRSLAFKALLKYLELGGVYVIISGNHLERTVSRIQKFIPIKLRNRVLICANGGADLVYFDAKGKVKELEDYFNKGLKCLKSNKKQYNLDFVYVGDDGRPQGNDKEAFLKAGAGQSILVAKDKTDDIISFLRRNHIGGLTAGTKAVLNFVNQTAKSKPGLKVFTKGNIRRMVQSARQF